MFEGMRRPTRRTSVLRHKQHVVGGRNERSGLIQGIDALLCTEWSLMIITIISSVSVFILTLDYNKLYPFQTFHIQACIFNLLLMKHFHVKRWGNANQ